MATGGADPGEAERHLSQCPVCWEVYVDPKALPCDHSLCARCVEPLKQGSRIKCPLCKVVHDVSRIRPDFRLQQFLDALTEEKQKKERRGSNANNGWFTFLSFRAINTVRVTMFFSKLRVCQVSLINTVPLFHVNSPVTL